MFSLNNFSENFSAYLKVRGLSQSEFARYFGVKANTVNQWANGKREPDFETLCKICVLFGVSFDEMLGYSNLERKKDGVLRFIIGENKVFQSEQKALQDNMRKSGKSDAEIQAECNKLYAKYFSEYESVFKF